VRLFPYGVAYLLKKKGQGEKRSKALPYKDKSARSKSHMTYDAYFELALKP